jgi:hypothetical protein
VELGDLRPGQFSDRAGLDQVSDCPQHGHGLGALISGVPKCLDP